MRPRALRSALGSNSIQRQSPVKQSNQVQPTGTGTVFECRTALAAGIQRPGHNISIPQLNTASGRRAASTPLGQCSPRRGLRDGPRNVITADTCKGGAERPAPAEENRRSAFANKRLHGPECPQNSGQVYRAVQVTEKRKPKKHLKQSLAYKRHQKKLKNLTSTGAPKSDVLP